jgi:heat shock protein HslJ
VIIPQSPSATVPAPIRWVKSMAETNEGNTWESLAIPTAQIGLGATRSLPGANRRARGAGRGRVGSGLCWQEPRRFRGSGGALRALMAVAVFVAALPLLTACGSGGSGASSGNGAKSQIVGVLWQWTGGQSASPPSLHAVPDPSAYLLRLAPDGSFEAQADCNQIRGTYTLSGQKLTLALGPTTMVACGPNSLDQTYVHQLGMVDSWSLTDQQLALALKNGDAMFFHEG